MPAIDLSFTTIKDKLPDFIAGGLAAYATASNSYFHQPEELRQKIADKHGVSMDSVYLTAGADQAITLLCATFGSDTHVFTPTYICYTDAKKLGGKFTEHQSLEDSTYSISTSKIDGASLIFLANPNNPAGVTKRETILDLVANNPNAKIVIDEAYGDFFDDSVIGDVANNKNLIVLRSFSKGYALAGFRIGYIVAHPEVLEQITLESTWFNVAYTSVGAAVTALNHEDYFMKMRESIISERQKTESYLAQLGYQVIPCHINAVLLRFADESGATSFVEKLEQADIRVNHGNGASNCGLDKTYVRVSVGTADQMQVFRDTLSH
ncbi:MAG: histidinol-phosphate aminotransferase family protein [Candidatus Saccharibacteria bacterium]|nr:histidinol-phosphate aminotransferase family protein [Candidatus Saccharibacteria bacterium]